VSVCVCVSHSHCSSWEEERSKLWAVTHSCVCACNWVSLVRNEDRLRVFGNRELREKFGPAMEKVTGEGIRTV